MDVAVRSETVDLDKTYNVLSRLITKSPVHPTGIQDRNVNRVQSSRNTVAGAVII